MMLLILMERYFLIKELIDNFCVRANYLNGSAEDLNISPVYDHIKSETPTQEKPKKEIVIPKKNSKNT